MISSGHTQTRLYLAGMYSRIVDDLELFSFLECQVVFCPSIVVVKSYEESDATTWKQEWTYTTHTSIFLDFSSMAIAQDSILWYTTVQYGIL